MGSCALCLFACIGCHCGDVVLRFCDLEMGRQRNCIRSQVPQATDADWLCHYPMHWPVASFQAISLADQVKHPCNCQRPDTGVVLPALSPWPLLSLRDAVIYVFVVVAYTYVQVFYLPRLPVIDDVILFVGAVLFPWLLLVH